MARRFAMLSAILLVSLLAGCKKPKVSEPCSKEGKQVCASKTDSLVCVSGRWEALPCRGAAGCAASGADVQCANDGYQDGEPCDIAEDDYECSVDRKAMLQCKAKHWKTVDECLGPSACTSSSKQVKCDNSVSELGAPCQDDKTYACTADGKQMMVCVGGKMVTDSPCRGGHGCRKQFDKIQCDTTVATAGDACEHEDDAACTVAGDQMLQCKGGKMTVARSCAGGCKVVVDEIHCN